MKNITLYTNPQSRGLITLWMLEECNAIYDIKNLAYGDAMKTPEYLAINPMGKVPALKYGDTVVTETAAIVTYLADLFPNKHLAPSIGDPKRGGYYRWIFFCANTFENALINQFLGFKSDHPDANKMLGYGNFESVLNTAETQLRQNHYFANNQFTAVDLLMSGLIMADINRFKLIPEDSILIEYATRNQQRPAYLKALAVNETLMS